MNIKNKFIENTFLFIVIHLYCLIAMPWHIYQIKQRDKQNQKSQITKEMMDKKIQDLNKFYGKKCLTNSTK
jgi:hypothetical protein